MFVGVKDQKNGIVREISSRLRPLEERAHIRKERSVSEPIRCAWSQRNDMSSLSTL